MAVNNAMITSSSIVNHGSLVNSTALINWNALTMYDIPLSVWEDIPYDERAQIQAQYIASKRRTEPSNPASNPVSTPEPSWKTNTQLLLTGEM